MNKKYLLAAIPPFAVWGVYKYIFARRRPPLLNTLLDKKTHCPEYYVWRDERAEALESKVHLCYTIQSERGETLQGFYFPCGKKFGKKIAFIVHGYHSEHAETAGMLHEYYHSRGFDIFCPDNTASGLSDGSWFGYDVFESADCLKWLGFLENEFGGDIQIILHGFSLGGATVMKMSDRVPDTVKFIVEDSGFVDARPILRSQLGLAYGLIAKMNEHIAGYSLDDTDVTGNLAHAKCPMLFAHGMDDPTVPFENAPHAFDACPNEKDCLFTEGTRHIETMFTSGAAYAAKIDAFITKYIK